MLSLREVVPNAGVPQDNFVLVPLGAPNLLWVDGGSGDAQIKPNGKVRVEKLSKSNYGDAVEKMIKQHTAGDSDGVPERTKLLKAGVLHAITQNPGRVFALVGKQAGFGKLQVSAGKESLDAEVGVSDQKSFKLAFRFLRHTEGSGTAPDTRHDPKAAPGWVAGLNWIFGPQANVHFTLQDTDWVTVPVKPDQPISANYFLEKVATSPSSDAHLTIYFVGDWRGSAGDGDGTFYGDKKVAVMTDSPNHPEIAKGTDVFLLVLAHELLHFLRERRGFKGHHDRKEVLLSTGVQTLRIDKQLVIDINIPQK